MNRYGNIGCCHIYCLRGFSKFKFQRSLDFKQQIQLISDRNFVRNCGLDEDLIGFDEQLVVSPGNS